MLAHASEDVPDPEEWPIRLVGPGERGHAAEERNQFPQLLASELEHERALRGRAEALQGREGG